jgi:preprotein translocase subunit SecA
LSLEDDLMRLFGGERVGKMMETLGIPDDQPIEHGLISRTIESAQHKIEGLNFDMRKHVLEYDDVMNKQRTIIYAKRKQILNRTEPLSDEILQLVEKEITDVVNMPHTHSPEDEDHFEPRHIYEHLNAILPLKPEDLKLDLDAMGLTNHALEIAQREYKLKQEKMDSAVLTQLEKFVYLRTIDQLWQQHLDTMEHLRDSVRLRGYGQRDPLQEFKNEGYQLFQNLLEEVNRQIVYTIFKVDVAPAPVQGPADPALKEIGRNDPCPCGSGKKYKKCGMLNTPEHQQFMAKIRE